MRTHLGRRSIAVLVAITAIVAGSAAAGSAGPKPTPKGYVVYFVRHGEASPANGPLSPLGQQQAAALATLLHDEPVNAVYTSTLERAIQTGAPTALDHGIPAISDARLDEMGFSFTGVPPAQIPAVAGARLLDWASGNNRDEGYGGESFNALKSRFDDWWHEFVREHKTDKGMAVVVAHGGLLGLMIPETCWNDIEPSFAIVEHGLFNTAIIKTVLHPNGTLGCTEWAGAPIPSAVLLK